MSSTHNHPIRCCCGYDVTDRTRKTCPACVMHGELTGLGDQDECPSCHQPAGRPPTDYCQDVAWHGANIPDHRTTLVDTGTMFATITTTPPSHTRIAGEGPTPAEANRDIPPHEHTPPLQDHPCTCPPLGTHPDCPTHR